MRGVTMRRTKRRSSTWIRCEAYSVTPVTLCTARSLTSLVVPKPWLTSLPSARGEITRACIWHVSRSRRPVGNGPCWCVHSKQGVGCRRSC